MIGFGGPPQVVIQLLRHVFQDQIGHANPSCAVWFANGSFSLILADCGSKAKPPKAEKSGAEKSEPARSYFSAPDVSALDSCLPEKNHRPRGAMRRGSRLDS
jgi:hypothetical protein